jgi:hypothetical protein
MFMECSALDGENIENIFNMVTKKVLSRKEEGLIGCNSPVKKIDIKPVNENDNMKKGYCQCSS